DDASTFALYRYRLEWPARFLSLVMVATGSLVFLGTGTATAATLSTQVTTATVPMADAAGTATNAVASCAAGTLVGGGISLGRVSDTATPNNGLKVNGTMPSDASGNPATNASTDPASWTAVGGYGGQAESGDQVTSFALCASGGPTHTEVVTATVAGTATQGNPVQVATATCPAGTTLIGGGALGTPPSQPSFKPIASYPSDVSGTAVADGSQDPTSWSAYGSAGQPDPTTQVVTALALCATDGGLSTTVSRVDASGPQTASTYTTTTASCATGTLMDGGFAIDQGGAQPQQGVHARGSFPSDAGGVAVGDGASNPSSWTTIVQAGGQNTPGTDVHAFALCAAAQVTPPSTADVSLAKTSSPDPVTVGSPLTYTLTAANAGPDPATGVSVTDPLPAGVSYTSASASQGSCTQASGTVSCTLGTLDLGATATVTIAVTPNVTGTVSNTASVSANETDPNPANNSATATTTVTAQTTSNQADVSLRMSGPGLILRSSPYAYTLTVSNAGPATATGVVAVDHLPSGVRFVSASSTKGSCKREGGLVTCSLGTLAPGASVKITLKVTAHAFGFITNVASVHADQPDPVPANNSAQVTSLALAVFGQLGF
ncbi:MAG TPA: DUF11 domain-containing protein, partial [Actinomycetota bacterium]|nr:DUF11 domain-containing protein [Actinomycetota bacterium]